MATSQKGKGKDDMSAGKGKDNMPKGQKGKGKGDDVDKGINKGSVGRNIPFRELVKAKGKPPGKAEIGKGDESAEPDFLFFM